MTAVMAFLHHVAAFALVAALAVELVLIRGELTPASARRLARVFYFEKGAAYINAGIDASAVPAIRRIIHLELAGVVLILLFAALMADGIGYIG